MTGTRSAVLAIAILVIIVLFAVAAYVLVLTDQVTQTEGELSTEFHAVHTVNLPAFYYNLNPNKSASAGDSDMWIQITLTYQGTLVAGSQTPITISGVAHAFSSSLNVSSIGVGFQDALVYPPQPAEAFRQAGSTSLMPTGSNDFGGSGQVYFPIEGSYYPIVSIVTGCSNGQRPPACSVSYLPRVVDVASLQVQPLTRLEDEKIAVANLQLTFGLYLFDLVVFAGVILAVLRWTYNYWNRVV